MWSGLLNESGEAPSHETHFTVLRCFSKLNNHHEEAQHFQGAIHYVDASVSCPRHVPLKTKMKRVHKFAHKLISKCTNLIFYLHFFGDI